jgi:uncharacterized protein YndB with AHSA1/START domain
MDAFRQINQTIHVDAPPGAVWSIFVNPELTRQLGGEYVTDWKEGSMIEWKDKSGVTQAKGTILQIIPEKLLKLQLEDMSNAGEILSTITYDFNDHTSFTQLVIEEIIHYRISNEEYHDANQVWKETLFAIADAAERIGLQ